MNKTMLFCLLATIAMAVASDDRDLRYRESPRKLVIVEKERPTYEVVKKIPEYKKTVYQYREPEEKKVLVKVVKEDERKYIVRPSYEPKKDVVVKILDRNH